MTSSALSLLFGVLFFYLSSMTSSIVAFAQESEDIESSSSKSSTKSNVSDELNDLELYSDIVVIQKKFFEKTSRWELSVSGVTSLNNKFFTSLGLKGTIGYHFSERWAVEGQAWYLTPLERDFTSDLEDQYQISTSDIVTPQGYLGLNLVWTPIYGKLSLQEKSVNPFELFFTLGAGVILTDDNQNAPALNMSFGQIHPLSPGMTLRWEIGGNVFSAKGKGSLQGAQQGKETISEIFYVSVGTSFFLPEAKR
jgi:outer membrane beta-barrel protein